MMHHSYRNALGVQHPVRYPASTIQVAGKIRKLWGRHRGERLGLETLVAETGESRQIVEDALTYMLPLVQIDHETFIGTTDPRTLVMRTVRFAEVTADPEGDTETQAIAMEREVYGPALLRSLLERLDPTERLILTKRFGLDGGREHLLREIGDLMGGYSRERARQIENIALRKLRTFITELPEHQRELIDPMET
jgi:DNA-directed RNA polymerase sigma subunit (sigma70/sigma32)